MRKIIHLLPYDGIGGAEAAARSMGHRKFGGLDFRLAYIFPKVRSPSRRAATFNPLAFFSTALAVRREAPDLLVLSLWRSCIVGLLVKLMRPRTRVVVVIHNSVDAHAGDWLFTRAAMALATAIWADSAASLRLRFRRRPRASVTILPFLTEHLAPAETRIAGSAVAPAFIFWGRLATQKNLRRALELFRAVHADCEDARFTIIGPDAGELAPLRQWTEQAGLSSVVRFAGPMSFSEICRQVRGHAFYLQTSDYEGMSMAVVEAMQLGLVPVVTPVGEIARYCHDGQNALLVSDTMDSAARLLGLLSDPHAYDRMRQAAIATWRDHPLYAEAVAAECRRLIQSTTP